MPLVDRPSPDPDLEPLSRMQILMAMGVTAFVLWMVATLWRNVGAVPLLPWHWGIDVLWGLGLGLGITLASSGVYWLWPAYRESADYYLALILQPLVWPDLIWLGLLPGLSEELLFRGVMIPALGAIFHSIPAGLVVSSLCFGILHLSQPKQWPYVLWATVVGLALGVGALLTQNLLVAMVAHITTNLISAIWWKWDHRPQSDSFPHS